MKARIKELLREQGLTMGDLAEKIGVAQASLSRMLGDNGNPTYDMLVKMVNALGLEMQDLFVTDKTHITCPKCGARFRLEE